MKHQRCLRNEHVGRFLVAAWLVLLGITVFSGPLGRLEGMIVPVSVDARVEIISNDAERTVFVVPALKVRDCNYYELRLSVSDGEGRTRRIAMQNLGPERIDRPGPVRYGPLAAHISADDLASRSTITVRHDCHPGFLTESTLIRPAGK